MNKTAIKSFAIWARNKLIADISYRAGLMGIMVDGIQKALPQSTGTTEFYDIGTAEPYSISGDAVKQRKHLVELIRRKEKETDYKTAYKYVLEEVAYTWFNRLIAVRFMEVNDYLPSHIRVLSSDSGKMEPDLVTTPFDAELFFTRDEEQLVYQLKQENKIDELFRILFVKQCNALNSILPALFEKTRDYTELLMNLSVIDQDGVVYHLVHDIPEEDFDVERGGQVEIIGWLYQYYNTEPKEEAFSLLKKNVKVTKERIPAVTQIFTPDWIVRYMVENGLGRLWLEGHPNDQLKAEWKYYLEEAEQEAEVQVKLAEIQAEYTKLNPEDIKVIDPCMGSGHILVYAFDVLMQIYESAGYGQRDAARSILENNLYGLDIDDRAFQMAYFSVMMKARQYSRRILNGDYTPNVYSIQESNEINREQLKYFGAGLNDFEKNNAITQMKGLLDTFKDAKEYGSILTVDRYDWDLLDRFVSNIEIIGQMSMYTVGLEDTAKELKQMIAQGKVLGQKYHVVTTNPPYMGGSGMNAKLSDFLKVNYPTTKSDLFSAFIERGFSLIIKHGFNVMVTMQSWMFLTSYSEMRSWILHNNTILNLIHMDNMVMGIAFGTSATVFRNGSIKNYIGTYDRVGLSDLKNDIPYTFPVVNKYYRHTNISQCEHIPNMPLAYWFTDKMISAYAEKHIYDISKPCKGIDTGDNSIFLRLWYEVNANKICFPRDVPLDNEDYDKKWFSYNKGGAYRKWYGNNDYVIDWSHNGAKLRNFAKSNLRNKDQYFKRGLTWSTVTSGEFSVRYFSYGYLFDNGGTCLFADENLYYILAYLNSSVARMYMSLSPTVNSQPGDIGRLPIIVPNNKAISEISELAQKCIDICRLDWDNKETSWGFKYSPLIKNRKRIEECYDLLSQEYSLIRNTITKCEKEIDTIFCSIFGLDDSDVESLGEEHISVKTIDERQAVIGLLSYAVGCMFGRYSLSSNGIIFAGGEWDEGKYDRFKPDVDNIIPISDEEYLEDDIISRLCTFIKVVFGERTLEENLDYIAKTLANKGDSSREVIRNYFLNDFFKDHCQTYSITGSGKRPIYWLFDSGKQNGFKALIYVHRYNADTIGNLRIDYLHRMQRIYESEISRMQDMIDHSTNTREVAQATKRREKLTKQLKECREYDEKLAHLALSRIELDLDDGVKKNYRKIQTASDGKFYEVLADSKNIMSKE